MKNLKKILAYSLVIGLMMGTSLTSCKKKEENNNNNNNTNNPPPPPPPNNPPAPTIYYDGVVSAVRSRVVTVMDIGFGPTTTSVFTEAASAAFKDGSSNNIADAGTVKVNDSILSKYSNNVYMFTKSNSDNTNSFTNFYNNNITWNIGGNTSTGVPSFTYLMPGGGVPQPSWNWTTTAKAPTVSISNGFVFKNMYNSSFDSIMIQIIGGGGNVFQKVLPFSTNNYTVTPSMLNGMQPTTNTMTPTGQVSYHGLKYYNTVVGTKTITGVKVSSSTWMAFVTN